MVYILIGLAVCLPIAMDAGAYVHTHLMVFLMKLADNNPDDNRSPQWVKGVLAVVEIVLPILFGTGYFVMTTAGDEECAWGNLDALCVVFVTAAITTLSKLGDDIRKEAREAELLASFNIDMIKDLDTDGDGVDKNDSTSTTRTAGKLTKDDLDLIDAKYKASAEASRSKVGRDLSMSGALERARAPRDRHHRALIEGVEDKLEAAEETIVKAGQRMTGASEADIVEAMEKKKERKARKKERKAAKKRAAAADNRAADAFCCLNPEMPADDAAARV
ncbi:potassium channel [Aureococcus anophagefferens]|uniref:Potassium channel n=1 Tax=Aureococcus anophagefferens TaxID=44056 RepID=A0ABR1GAZ0_AURAN